MTRSTAPKRPGARAARREAERRSRHATPATPIRDAVHRHRGGDLAAAEAAYQAVLHSTPDDVDALHFLGVLRHQQGRTPDGVELIRRALALAPDHVDAWCNLGNLHKESGRLDQAESAYREALALDDTHAPSWNNLAVVLRASGKGADAVAALRRAIGLAPGNAEAYVNLGAALRDAGCTAEAISVYREAIAADPRQTRAHYWLGQALYVSGAVDEAANVFATWLKQSPGDPIATHMLAACSGHGVPDRASDAYIRSTFDSFAGSFDEILLQRLHYHAPQRLLDFLAMVLAPPAESPLAGPALDVLDAGCGTGLCGPLLKPFARSLCGVDLSSRMLARARARGVYDALHEEEITHFLGAHPESFHVIASADTLCYFGDLASVFDVARRALRSEGWLAFTIERGDDGEAFRLQSHGRYRHGRNYVEASLATAAFSDIALQAVTLRRELGVDVAGWVVRARRGR